MRAANAPRKIPPKQKCQHRHIRQVLSDKPKVICLRCGHIWTGKKAKAILAHFTNLPKQTEKEPEATHAPDPIRPDK